MKPAEAFIQSYDSMKYKSFFQMTFIAFDLHKWESFCGVCIIWCEIQSLCVGLFTAYPTIFCGEILIPDD